MMRRQERGWFITVEGIDGCGKTTQVERLCSSLAVRGIPFIRTREPGGTPMGDKIRALLLDPSSEMTPATEVYLYAAARAEHVRQTILPALKRGEMVVSDRFVDASVAYQGYGLNEENIGPDVVRAVNDLAVAGLLPDLTLIIDVPVEVAERRLRNSGRGMYDGLDRLERRGTAFFERVRQGLREVAHADPERFVWLDGRLSPDDLERDIWAVIEKYQREG